MGGGGGGGHGVLFAFGRVQVPWPEPRRPRHSPRRTVCTSVSMCMCMCMCVVPACMACLFVACRYFVSLLRLCAEVCTGNNGASSSLVSTAYPHDAILAFMVLDPAVVSGGSPAKDVGLVQSALGRILRAAHLQQPSGNRLGSIPMLLTAFEGAVEPAAPILPPAPALAPETLGVVVATKRFAAAVFSRMAATKSQTLTIGGANLAVDTLDIVVELVGSGHYSGTAEIRALSSAVVAAFRPWAATVKALSSTHGEEMAALTARSLDLRCKLYGSLLDLKVDAKLAAFVRAVVASNVTVDDAISTSGETLNESQLALFKPLFGAQWKDDSAREPVLTWADLFDISTNLHGSHARSSPLSLARVTLLLRAVQHDKEFLTALSSVQLVTDVDKRSAHLKLRQDLQVLQALASKCHDVSGSAVDASGDDSGDDSDDDGASESKHAGGAAAGGGDGKASKAGSRKLVLQDLPSDAVVAEGVAVLRGLVLQCVVPRPSETGSGPADGLLFIESLVDANSVAVPDGQATMRALGLHTIVVSMLRTLSAPSGASAYGSLDDDTPRGRVARPLLRAGFAFLAAFAFRNDTNKALVWRAASDVIEDCVSLNVNAELALAEVVRDNEMVAHCFSTSLVTRLTAGFNSATRSHHGLVALRRCMTVNGVAVGPNQELVLRLLLAPANTHVHRLLAATGASGTAQFIEHALGPAGERAAATALAEVLSGVCLGGNALAVDVCQAMLSRHHVVAAIVKCTHEDLAVKAALVELFNRVWAAPGKEDGTFHDHSWAVLGAIMADLAVGVRHPHSTLTRVASSTYASFVLAYLRTSGAGPACLKHQALAHDIATSLSLLWTVVPDAPATLHRSLVTARAVARLAQLASLAASIVGLTNVVKFVRQHVGVDPCNPGGDVEDGGQIVSTALGVGFLCDLEINDSRKVAVALQETVARCSASLFLQSQAAASETTAVKAVARCSTALVRDAIATLCNEASNAFSPLDVPQRASCMSIAAKLAYQLTHSSTKHPYESLVSFRRAVLSAGLTLASDKDALLKRYGFAALTTVAPMDGQKALVALVGSTYHSRFLPSLHHLLSLPSTPADLLVEVLPAVQSLAVTYGRGLKVQFAGSGDCNVVAALALRFKAALANLSPSTLPAALAVVETLSALLDGPVAVTIKAAVAEVNTVAVAGTLMSYTAEDWQV
jgi:hypothetical protein